MKNIQIEVTEEQMGVLIEAIDLVSILCAATNDHEAHIHYQMEDVLMSQAPQLRGTPNSDAHERLLKFLQSLK
jgi:hypothetical protein